MQSTDKDAISEWTVAQKYVYLVFYQDDQFYYSAGWWGLDDELPDSALGTEKKVFPVYFRDRTLTVSIYDYSEYRLQQIWDSVLLLLSAAMFVLIMLIYSQRLTKRVVRLSKEVEQLGSKDLMGEVTIKGSDEIAALAMEINNMRHEIIHRMQTEQKAVQANTDLITAISHDIRTPLTALIGYLDLAIEGEYDSPEKLGEYLRISQEKAMQLKSMTDELFRYFLVFGQGSLTLQMENYQAEILLEQILGEHCAQLQLAGFRVKLLIPETGEIRVDVQYLRRVFDNLFSNVEKYADRAAVVTVLAEQQAQTLHIFISNTIAPNPNHAVSTKIGLKSAHAVMEQMGGKLLITEEKQKFVVEVVLPLVDQKEVDLEKEDRMEEEK